MTDKLTNAIQYLGSTLDSGFACTDPADPQLKAFRDFSLYLTCRTRAIAARLQGDIDRALQEEGYCDALYLQLPKEWQW